MKNSFGGKRIDSINIILKILKLNFSETARIKFDFLCSFASNESVNNSSFILAY
jgi:hypothetical protein